MRYCDCKVGCSYVFWYQGQYSELFYSMISQLDVTDIVHIWVLCCSRVFVFPYTLEMSRHSAEDTQSISIRWMTCDDADLMMMMWQDDLCMTGTSLTVSNNKWKHYWDMLWGDQPLIFVLTYSSQDLLKLGVAHLIFTPFDLMYKLMASCYIWCVKLINQHPPPKRGIIIDMLWPHSASQ